MDVTRKLVAVTALFITISMSMVVASGILTEDADAADYVIIVYDDDDTQEVEKTMTKNFIVKTPDPRPGYTFQYWIFNGMHVTAGSHNYSEFIGQTGSVWHFYSEWSGNEYQAKFMDGSKLIESKMCIYGSKIGQLPSISKTGSDFVGWSPSGSSADLITADTEYSTVGDQIYFAVWDANVYQITMYNHGDVYDVIERTYGEVYGDLPTPAETGYSFKGWSLDESGTNIVSKDTQYFLTEDSSLYAIWEPLHFTISFDDGGTVIDSKVVDYDGEIGDMPAPTRKGYTFLGWSTDGTEGNIVRSDTVFTYLEDITLYSVWKVNSYNISFIDGSTKIASKEVKFDSAIGEMPTLMKVGYTFLGWSTDGTEKNILAPGTSYTYDRDIELYSVWSANTHTITFVSDGKECDSMKVRYGEKIGHMRTVEKIGKNFMGWSLDGTQEKVVTPDTPYVWDSDMTLYSVWSDIGYTIRFINEGTEVSSKTISYGMRLGDLPTVSSIGKTFIGWSFDTTRSGLVTSETQYEQACDSKLYAYYEKIYYTVTFDPNGGKTTPEPMKLGYNEPFGTLPTIERDGHKFIGWSATPDGTSILKSDSKLTQADDITLYAVWEDTRSIFEDPVAIVIIVLAIAATIGVCVWVYRKGAI